VIVTAQATLAGIGGVVAQLDLLSGAFPTPCPCYPPTTDCTDPVTFREHFPEFDHATYPNHLVQTYLDLGGIMCSPDVWLRMRQRGIELVAAHMLALHQYAMLSAYSGGTGVPGVPGLARGLIASKSVSKVSVGYDVRVGYMESAGPWNYTVYGQEYYWWLRLVGTGGYETLSAGSGSMVGVVNTWARGVQLQWGS
jgi:hypothetical protein